jgi:hypothetical protein
MPAKAWFRTLRRHRCICCRGSGGNGGLGPAQDAPGADAPRGRPKRRASNRPLSRSAEPACRTVHLHAKRCWPDFNLCAANGDIAPPEAPPSDPQPSTTNSVAPCPMPGFFLNCQVWGVTLWVGAWRTPGRPLGLQLVSALAQSRCVSGFIGDFRQELFILS